MAVGQSPLLSDPPPPCVACGSVAVSFLDAGWACLPLRWRLAWPRHCVTSQLCACNVAALTLSSVHVTAASQSCKPILQTHPASPGNEYPGARFVRRMMRQGSWPIRPHEIIGKHREGNSKRILNLDSARVENVLLEA